VAPGIGQARRSSLWRRGVALAACWLVAVSSTASVLAAPAPPAQTAPSDDAITVTADRVEYNSVTMVVRADGHVRATGSGAVITADHVEANTQTEEVVAAGHVTLTQGEKTIEGSFLRYNFRTQVGRFEQAVGQLGVWHISAEAIDVAPREDVATDASITPCDPDHPVYKVTAKKIVIVPGQYFTAYDASLWVAGTRVITVPVYAGNARGRSGPGVAYNTLDGFYIEYANSFPLAGWRDEYRIRLATMTGLSAENVLSQRFGDHIWKVDLGRSQVKDQGGNLVNLDRYSLDLEYDRARIPGWPIDVQFEAHAGSYRELASGVSTTRADAVASLTSAAFALSPSVFFSAGGRVHYDVYGTGQHQAVIEGSAAMFGSLSPRASASLSYDLVSINGSTPFSFDSYSPTSSVTLNYNYIFGGFVQSAGASITYGFLAMQTTLGLNTSLSIDPNTAFNISAQYNLTTQQLTEVDYALNVRCDCVTVGLVYQTFPQSPGSNRLMVTIQLNAFPGRTVTFSGSGVGF
jgi:lipopolysaccharide assembly outer membrane protein LptD (OstA)